MKLTKNITTLAVISSMFFLQCGKDNVESKSMEQLHRDNGIPVNTVTVDHAEFKVDRIFHAELTGKTESNAYAAIGDKVERIHYQVGSRVEKDDVVITFPEDSPSAQYNQVKLSLNNAETFYQRMKNMYDAGGISKQDLDNAKTQYEVTKANWDAVQQSVEVKAPISGVITRMYVEETDNVQKESPLFTVSNTEQLKAVLWINEKYIDEFKPGLSAMAKWKDIEISGSVQTVDLAFDDMRKAFRAVVIFDNPGSLLTSGIDAEISVITNSKADAFVLERQILFFEENNTYVYVAENETAAKRRVVTGGQSKLHVEILQGLSAGDQVITQGRTLVSEGVKINRVAN